MKTNVRKLLIQSKSRRNQYSGSVKYAENLILPQLKDHFLSNRFNFYIRSIFLKILDNGCFIIAMLY